MLTENNVELVQRFIRLPLAQREVFYQRLQAKGMSLSRFPIPATRMQFERLPLSYAQERQWFLWRLHPESTAYHITAALRVRGPLHVEHLQRSLNQLVERHDSLRTVFEQSGEQVFQRIEPGLVIALDRSEVEADSAGSADQHVQDFIASRAKAPFDLTQGPLARACLLRIGADDHVLVLVQHHIISDGASMQVIVDEWVRLYQALNEGVGAALPPLAIQYADYAIWQRSWMEAGERARQLDYWTHQLGSVQPVLELPLDHARPVSPSPRGARLTFSLDQAMYDGLRELAQRKGMTLFMLLLASFQTLLHRYTGQDDIRVGVPIANRQRTDTQGVIGFFVNTQVLRAEFSPGTAFEQLLDQVRETAQQAQAHQDLPFEQLVEALQPERSLGHTPLFQVLFNHQRGGQGDGYRATGLDISPIELAVDCAKFDLTLETFEDEAGLHGALLYRTDLFDGSTAERIIRHLRCLLASVLRDPDQEVAQIDLFTQAEHNELLKGWGHPVPQAVLPVHEQFAHHAAHCPDVLALVAQGAALTYRQLDSNANGLAAQLVARGVRPGDIVGIYAHRDAELAVGILAVLKAGAAYLPLDPQLPTQRLDYLLQDAGVAIVAGAESSDGHARFGARWQGWTARPDAEASTFQAAPVMAGQLAYVIYTSGTTGLPKGVAISHGALAHYVEGVGAELEMDTIQSMAMASTPAADLGHTMFYGALCNGKVLHLIDRETSLDSQAFVQYLGAHHVDALKLVPSHLEALLGSADEGMKLVRQCLVLGGESPSSALLQRLAQCMPDVRVINHYGPTETTVGVLVARLQAGTPPRLDRTLRGSRAVVLGNDLQLMPAGTVGELMIGGTGLARGYLGRPGLTAERFVPDPLGDQAGARLYRTGDRVRALPDGGIRYLERLDHQVKVRGFRVETREVVEALKACPDVHDAVVVDVQYAGATQLVGYLVMNTAADPDDEMAERIRSGLKQTLPDYMVPARLMCIERLPLTANGKLDRAALPLFDVQDIQAQYVAPTTEVEQRIAEVWAQLLDVPRIGLHDNFFRLGGHSLLAMAVIARLRQQAGIEVPLRALFEAADLQGFARFAEARTAGAQRITPRTDAGPVPLSHAQQRQWFLWQLDPSSTAYNLPMALALHGALDLGALAHAFSALIERHETLRTIFVASGEEVVQQVLPPSVFSVSLERLPGADDAAVRRWVEAVLAEPFDLASGPLIRCTVLQRSDTDHVLALSLHHIVADGGSMPILVRELLDLYAAARSGQPSQLAALPIQYADYALWERQRMAGPEGQRQLQYWVNQLEGEQPVIELPLDRPRPAVQSTAGATLRLSLDEQRVARLKAFAEQHQLTLFMLLLASFNLTLYRYSGQKDLRVGIPMANRNRVETEGMIGFFVNTQVIRTRLEGEQSVTQLLSTVRETVLQAQENPDLPFEFLVDALAPERSLSHNPLFQVMFNHQAAAADGNLSHDAAGLRVQPVTWGNATTHFDLSLSTYEHQGQLRAAFGYSTSLFDAPTIERLAQHWQGLLLAMITEPDARLGEVPMPGGEQILLGSGELDSYVPVHESIRDQAERRPHATAIIAGGTRLTYRQLDRQANHLAHRLQALGVGPDHLVAVALPRTATALVGYLAVLKAGGGYVPMDLAYPPERLKHMLKDSGAGLLLSELAQQPLLPDLKGVQTVWLDDGQPGDAPERHDPPRVCLQPQNLAYVIYTSGSTGLPKGVAVPHGAIAMHCQATARWYEMSEDDCELHFLSFAFDGAHERWLTTCIQGGRLLLRDDELWSPEYTYEQLRVHEVTMAGFPPAYLQQLAAHAEQVGNPPPVRLYSYGGDAMPKAGFAQVQKSLRPALMINGYGPTEAVVTPMVWKTGPHDRCDALYAPIGQCVGERHGVVMDDDLCAKPENTVGELYLGGQGLARGYLNRPALTAERFVPDPFGEAGARLYRTGDLVKSRGGCTEYLGRADHQIKVRGFRIEPGEVESCLTALPGVRDAVVSAQVLASGAQLVAHVLPASLDVLTDVESMARLREVLRSGLRAHLPDYMVPSFFVFLAQWPVTPNGKLDRRALPAADPRQNQQAHEAPSGPVEQRLCEIWASVLSLPAVGVRDNFFEIGGDSIVSIQVVSRARQSGIHITPKDLFQHQTVRALAAVATVSDARQVAGCEAVEGRVPLLPIQRLFFGRPMGQRDHWNQSVLLQAVETIDLARLIQAVAAVVQHHDALRTRFTQTQEGWEASIASASDLQAEQMVWSLDITDEAQWAPLCERAQRSLSLNDGPLLRAVLAQCPQGQQRLLLIAHHAVIDGVSWRVVLQDLQQAYSHAGSTPVLPARTTSVKTWAERLQGYAADPCSLNQVRYWEQQLQGVSDCFSQANAQAALVNRHALKTSVRLSQAQTRRLLQEAPAAYRTRINDLLLTALVVALRHECSSDAVPVLLEGHGRELLWDDLDLTRTVGWLTSIYPVRLSACDDLATAICSVKEQLRGVPDNGLSFGVLRELAHHDVRQRLNLPLPRITFNYLGQLDSGIDDANSLFQPAPWGSGTDQNDEAPLGNWLTINAQVFNGELSLSWTFSREMFSAQHVQGLADGYIEALQRIIDHCCEPQHQGLTPSDVELCDFTQSELDALRLPARHVQDAYPLSPMQHGMLFHAVFEPDSLDYINQLRMDLTGLDVGRFIESWQMAVSAHDILRTGFIWHATQPVQVVYKHTVLPVQVFDWREQVDVQTALEQLASAQRREGFDLRQAPLLRIALVHTAPGRHHLIYTCHHLLMDGWSNSQLLAQVLQHYSGQAVESPVGRYRDYIAWLQDQDAHANASYWQQSLVDLAEPTLLAQAIRLHPDERGAGHGDVYLELDHACSERLVAGARACKLTLNTLVQGAWALLLQRFTGHDCVAFGATVAGRPAQLPGIEQQIGLFINTLAVVTTAKADERAQDWLQRLQAINVSLREQEHTRLADVQRWANSQGRSLFDTLLVFENYPVAQALQEKAPAGLGFENVSNVEQTSFPFTLLVNQGERLSLHANFDRAAFGESTARALLGHLVTLMCGLIDDLNRPLGQLSTLDPDQRSVIVGDFNRTLSDTSGHLPVHQGFEQQVERTPETIALVCADQTLTYQALDERANAVAHRLLAVGVGAQTLVGVCAERSVEMVVALLGILKAGAAYVPFDPDYPSDRLTYMVEDSGVGVLLCQAHLADRLPLDRVATPLILETIGRSPVRAPSGWQGAQSLAYMIYTSGSTGRPKGAANRHGALSNRIAWMQRAYSLGPQDVVLQKTPFSFDVSVWEFFWPLSTGARLVMAGPGDHRDPARLIELIERHQVSTLHFVPSMLQVFLQDARVSRCRSLSRVFCSGEALAANTQNALFKALPGAALYNLYGPTEAAIDVTHWTCRNDGQDGVPIGWPIDNLACHVLDDCLEPVPVGVRGELYLAGAGLGRGYHRRPGLTAERFPASPFQPGERLYRTGDLACYRADGAIEYLGRIDHQVKLRGLRIELGEIEARLLEHPLVLEATVQAVESRFLAAWVVLADDADTGEAWQAVLMHWLNDQLPEYMVPTQWQALEQMPLSPNGKLDRKALPAIERRASDADGAPLQGAREQALADLFAQVLRVEEIGALDNFFELGGDSIVSIQLVARARQQGIEITPKDVFQYPTIRALAARSETCMAPPEQVESAGPLHALTPQQVGRLPLDPQRLVELYPLSPMQQGMLFQSLNSQGSNVYVNQLSISVTGLDAERFTHAIEQACDRHTILRTGFFWQDLPEPVQFVLDRVDSPVTVLDWREEPDPEARHQAYAAQVRSQGLKLDQPSLQHIALVRTGQDTHQLIWTYHHLLVDGWSLSQLIGEVLTTYAGGQVTPGRPYRDYIAWLQRQDAEAGERFWRAQVAELEEPCLLANAIPAREQRQGHEALYSRFDADRTERFTQFARSQRVTLNTLIQGAWLVLLSRYTGQRTVAFGSTVAGRSPSLPGADRILGLFINTLPVVHTVDPERRIGDWLRDLQDRNVHMREHEYVALADIQRWAGLPGRPLFDSIIVFENHPVDQALREWNDPSLQFGPSSGAGLTDFPMDLMVTNEGAQLCIEYMHVRRHFDPSTVASIRLSMESILDGLIASGDDCLGNVALTAHEALPVPAVEGEAILVHERIRAWADEHGQAVAVMGGEQTLTYRALDQRANALALRLVAAGAGPEVRVAVGLARTPDILVALLAVLKAGAVYVPLDLGYPRERLAYILGDCEAHLVLTAAAQRHLLPIPETVQCLEVDAMIHHVCETGPQVALSPDNLAYVIYTSGSTGQPKGVAVAHGPLARHCQAIGALYEMSPQDCELHFMSFAFDGAQERWLVGLTHGARILLRDDQLWTAEQTCMAMREHGVTVAAFPPAYLQQLTEHAEHYGAPPSMRVYCFGGDAVPQSTYERARRVLGARYLINGYGPTETVITPLLWKAAASQVCDAAYAPIGQAVGARSTFVLDDSFNPSPALLGGELYLGSALLARGYLQRPGLTAERFIPDPLGTGARLYRTGDRVLRDGLGTFHYLGRLDNQVKLRGLRIELGEIEAALNGNQAVREAVVVAREVGGVNRLVAYVVLAEKGAMPALEEQLREALLARLPDYMVPSFFEVLPMLPLTPNGKVDRRNLPDPVQERPQSLYAAPQTLLQTHMAEIWQKVLKVEKVGIHDSFFELGGDSILSLQVIARSRSLKAMGLELRLRDLMQKPTIAALTQAHACDGPGNAVLAMNSAVSGRAPVFCVHAGYGTVFDYEPLAKCLNGQRQVLAIQSRMLLDPTWSDDSLHSMAQDYVGFIRALQPQGPYSLLGWSLGATLVTLMTAELERQGQSVSFLGLLDGYVPGGEGAAQAASEVLPALPRSAAAMGFSDEDVQRGLETGRCLKALAAQLGACPAVNAAPHCWWVQGRQAEVRRWHEQLGTPAMHTRWLDCGHFDVPHADAVLSELSDLLCATAALPSI
ncbi:non-ribosomal peptide synthase/polyketide synthase [Pseudomonas silvicola]|nr:non-ribosomal peptide synthase/polyketide synthase [Pseudomonas silvicola]